MTTASLAMAWLQLLALLAAEVGLIALEVALLLRWSPASAWRRTFCQAGITAVLVVTVCELSGSARVLGGWAANALTWRGGDRPAGQTKVPQPESKRLLQPNIALASGSAPSFVGQPSRLAGEEASTPRVSTPIKQTSPIKLARSATHPSDAVGDTMGVLWVCLVWAVGAALAGARICLAQCLFMVFQHRRRPVAEQALAERIQALARTLGIRRQVRVVESGRLTCPIAFGLVRPTVGLPPDFARRFDTAKQNAMLAHELAHLAAHDPFWCLLADVATVVLWWHPGVWWLRRQLHLASEMAADEASLLVADGPRALAECLVELGARLTRPMLLGQLQMAGFHSHLGRRVQELVRLEGRAWTPLPRLGAAMIRIFGPMATTAIVVLCTAWAAPQALTNGDSMKTMQLNWKRSLATFALLTAFNGSDATSAVAQSDKPEPPAAPAPAVAPAIPANSGANSEATEAPSAPKPPPPPAAAEDAFRRRYGLTLGPSQGYPVDLYTNAAKRLEPLGKRYGLGGGPDAGAPVGQFRQAENPARGSKVEAKLKQIVLPEVTFDGLPLGEVLKFLSDESIKRDPDKTGVNFLINPNFHPVAIIGATDPATGLPLAATAEQFDMAAVIVKFNMPLRNVTMKDVLDAIVLVADHPIEYTLEDYAVVFAAKAETVEGRPVTLARPGLAPEPPQVFRPQPSMLPMVTEQPKPPGKTHKSAAELADIKPQPLNLDFGSGSPSAQVGPAAVGRAGDFWNGVAVPYNDHHTESDLKFAGGGPSPIEVEMINLGGCWHNGGAMGVKAPMFNTFNYPTGSRGGNSTVILHQVPPGKYTVYIYGHGPNPIYYGDYTLTVGTQNYGRKQTTHNADAVRNTKWVEGSQYVRFSNVKVGEGEEIEVLIQPGEQVTDPSGRTFADAMICGLQLVPVK